MQPLFEHLKPIERFRKAPPMETLFELDLTLIKRKICPICFHKLYTTRKGSGYCKNKKHKKFWVNKI